MIEALLGELAVAGGTEVVTAAGKHLAEKIKTSKDIKKLFVDAGEFFIDFEPQAEQLFQDMSLVLSKENMMKLASELKNDSGYTFKNRLLNSLISLMNKYEIPREYATFYANSILYTILNQLPEVAPQKYDRYFQSEWREEQEKTLLEIKHKIDKVNCEIELYKSKSIAIESAGQLDVRIRKQTNNPRIGIEFFDIDDDNRIVVHDDPTATDKGARKALDLDWDKCVIWVGMPVMTASGDFIGYIDVVTFDRESGAIVRVSTENGAANDALLGKRIIPASYIKGFRRGQGIALAPMGEYNGEDLDEATETGAILVADRTLELPIEGGAAAAAGKATAVVTDKAKKGAAKAKVAVDEKVEQAKPVAKKVAEKTGEAVNEGAFVVGRQLGRTKGMFSAFKEEFDKASREDD